MQWNFKFYFTSFPIYIDGVLLPLTFMTRIFEILSNHPNLLLYTCRNSYHISNPPESESKEEWMNIKTI